MGVSMILAVRFFVEHFLHSAARANELKLTGSALQCCLRLPSAKGFPNCCLRVLEAQEWFLKVYTQYAFIEPEFPTSLSHSRAGAGSYDTSAKTRSLYVK
jgi:hypothetical protein